MRGRHRCFYFFLDACLDDGDARWPGYASKPISQLKPIAMFSGEV